MVTIAKAKKIALEEKAELWYDGANQGWAVTPDDYNFQTQFIGHGSYITNLTAAKFRTCYCRGFTAH